MKFCLSEQDCFKSRYVFLRDGPAKVDHTDIPNKTVVETDIGPIE